MTVPPDLTGQTAIVTGGGRGIGRAIALTLGRCGVQVIVSARTKSQIEDVAKEILHAGGMSDFIPCDLADEDQIKQVFDFTIKKFGRLDILVNNAAIGRYGPFADFSGSDLNDLLSINIRGTYLFCQKALQIMIPEKSGYIINISSVVGIKGYENQSAYTATKHAIVGMTKVLAVEAQPHNIRASLIHPSGVDTDLVGQARPDLDQSILLKPEDIAQTVLFLLSLPERAAIDEIYIRRRGSSPF